MAMYVNTNVAALNGQRNLQNVTDQMNSTFQKLSSGSRINSARDDAAGLQISDRLQTQITGLSQANRNANDGISIAQIAEGALGEITTNVQRMRQLAVQGGNQTLSADDRTALGEEFAKLLNTNNDIANRTAYGTTKILNYDSNSSGFQVQSGAQSSEQDTVTTGNAMLTSLFGKLHESEVKTGAASAGMVLSTLSSEDLSDMGTLGKIIGAYMIVTGQSDKGEAMSALFGSPGLATISGEMSNLATDSRIQIDVDEFSKILNTKLVADGGTGVSAVISNVGTSAFTGISAADVLSTGYSDAQLNLVTSFATDALLVGMSGLVSAVDTQRAKLGAEQSSLASTVRSNTAAIVNVSDSKARITDTDFASETANLTRNQIIQQAATSILSQANQLPNAALSLLR